MGVERNIEIGRRQGGERLGHAALRPRRQGGDRRLGLIGAHQRAAAGIAEDDHPLDTGLLAQPAHAHADVDQGVFEDEQVLGAAITGVPAQKAEAGPGEIGGDIVFGEIDVVVGGDQRRLGLLAPLGVQ